MDYLLPPLDGIRVAATVGKTDRYRCLKQSDSKGNRLSCLRSGIQTAASLRPEKLRTRLLARAITPKRLGDGTCV